MPKERSGMQSHCVTLKAGGGKRLLAVRAGLGTFIGQTTQTSVYFIILRLQLTA